MICLLFVCLFGGCARDTISLNDQASTDDDAGTDSGADLDPASFSFPVPTGPQTGVIQIHGVAGADWVNVAAFINYDGKIGSDVTPVDGAFTIPINTARAVNGSHTISAIAFVSPAGEAGGDMKQIDFTLIASNAPHESADDQQANVDLDVIYDSALTAWTILGRDPSQVMTYTAPDYANATADATPVNPSSLKYFHHNVYLTDGVDWYVASGGGWQAVAGNPDP